jgi:hypothetical protein
MINSITEYIAHYVEPFNKNIYPGEHHFVALYLAPKIYNIGKLIPDYVNPDGMKRLPGDLIYMSNMKNRLSIEVKFLKINFTKTQCNDWLLSSKYLKPDYIVALGMNYLLIHRWELFNTQYKHITFQNKNIEINKLDRGYTPIITVDDFCKINKTSDYVFSLNDKYVDIKIDEKISEIIKEYK